MIDQKSNESKYVLAGFTHLKIIYSSKLLVLYIKLYKDKEIRKHGKDIMLLKDLIG